MEIRRVKNELETNIAEQGLEEDIVKKVALRFLRHHYKFRLRFDDQPVVAKYDLQGVGGIIADGYYSFKKPDGKPFTATFEASSLASKDEVSYKPQQNILFWDGLTMAAIVVVFLSSLNLRYQFHLLNNAQYLERASMILFCGGVTFVIFYLFAQKFRRYRYIYAIEQFKKYYADEQWIALASDVFESPNDRNLRELKNQCVHNGFGLVVIDKNLDPRIVITPSRQDIFVGKRKKVEFQAANKAQEVAQQKEFGLVFGFFGNKLPAFLKRDKSVLRYRRGFYNQILVTTICVVLLGVIFSKEMQNPNFKVVSKTELQAELASGTEKLKENSDKYLPDSSATTPKLKKAKPQKEEGFWALDPPNRQVAEAETSSPLPSQNEFTEKGGAATFLYDCARFYNFDGKKYIVEVGEYQDWNLAKNQVEQLRNKKIESAALLKSCFTAKGKGFIVYAGLFCNSADEAARQTEDWTKAKLISANIAEDWKIRAIEPVVE